MNGAVIFLWVLSALFAAIIGLPLLGYMRHHRQWGTLWLSGGLLCLEGVGFYVGMCLWKGTFLDASMTFLLVMLVNRIADALYEVGKRKGL